MFNGKHGKFCISILLATLMLMQYAAAFGQGGYSAALSQGGYSSALSQDGYSSALSQGDYSSALSQGGYAGHWAERDIDFLVREEIIVGDEHGNINPDSLLTRAEFVTIVNKTFGYAEKSDKNFPDVAPGTWYYSQFATARQAGYIKGDEFGYAHPDDYATRAEVAVILSTALGLKAISGESGFADNDGIPAWALASVIAMNEHKLLKGYPDGSVRAGNNLTRAEAITLIANIIDSGLLYQQAGGTGEDASAGDTGKDASAGGTGEDANAGGTGEASAARAGTRANAQANIQPKARQSTPESGRRTGGGNMAGGNMAGGSTAGGSMAGGSIASGTRKSVPGAGGGESTTPGNKKPDTELAWEDIDFESDIDGDGLVDIFEDTLKTDKTNPDTDGDGLLDGFEFKYLPTCPLLIDTDGNGISDADEDYDGDGLTNIQEQRLGTRPDEIDTDGDELSDGDEVNIYGTDPLKYDTDGDGLSDGEEIKLGLDPRKAKTDGITPDSERKFLQTAAPSAISDALLQSNRLLKPSISGNVPGDISKRVWLRKERLSSFEHYIGVESDFIRISTSYTAPLTLSFSYDNRYQGNAKNLCIVSYDDNDLQIVDTLLDEAGKTLSGEITGSGIYFVLDLDIFLLALGIDVFKNTAMSPMQYEPLDIYSPYQAAEFYPAAECDPGAEFYPAAEYDSDTREMYLYPRETGSMRKADIVFVIDTTGSMSGPIKNVKNNVKTFADKLVNNYAIDANFALVEYRDINFDGAASTRVHKSGGSDWFQDADGLISEIGGLSFGGGGDARETPIDGLEAARRLDYRANTSKFVVLVTNALYKADNSYGIHDLAAMTDLFVFSETVVSIISHNRGAYEELYRRTGGIYSDIYGNFSKILLDLAAKIDDVTNKGEVILLDDFQIVKLTARLQAGKDTDGDGIADKDELKSSMQKDVTPLILALLSKNSLPAGMYSGERYVTMWSYYSNPGLPDTDFDGIPDGGIDYDGKPVAKDPFPRSNSFFAKLYWEEDNNMKKSANDVEFAMDYSLLFMDNREYHGDLSVLASIFACDIYDKTYMGISPGGSADGQSGGTAGGQSGSDVKIGPAANADDPTYLGSRFGLKDVEDIKINGADYGVDADDSTEIVIGHRKAISYNDSREIIVVVVRGTNKTNSEWSSNFDVGADTPEYYAATGSSHPDWANKLNHKGFDVASNRAYAKISGYIARHSLDTAESKTILITGHSRGAAIANLLGARFEKDPDFTSFTYTFAAPNPTTDSDTDGYKTIFNIVNKDDIIPFLPLDKWGFKKYGAVNYVSVKDNYVNNMGDAEIATWEWLSNADYKNDSGTQNTLDAFAKIAGSRNGIYVPDGSTDGRVVENNFGHLSREGAENELAELAVKLRSAKLLRFCKLDIIERNFPKFKVEINYCPAYLMQMLANMATNVGWPLGRDLSGIYNAAKMSFVASSGKLVVIGGMTHPHLPVTYYLIAYNDRNIGAKTRAR